MRVAIIGAGLQARRRAPVVKSWPGAELVVVSASHKDQAEKLAGEMNCEAAVGWEEIVTRSDVDIVLVCTPPDSHAAISIAAMNHGKNVLCEKPLARTTDEAEEMLAVAAATGMTLKCGFNHRHHPAVLQAYELLQKGELGKPLFGRCVYGIGGRPGYENEWRADSQIVAGGQFMEQGIHAVDLFRWFLGDFEEVTGFTSTQYWQIAPLEDNGFAVLRNSSGVMASIHSSVTQWKNIFQFEVYGSDGYIKVEGLGGGYGTEKLVFGKKDFYAPFKEEITEFRGADRSWSEEWKEFVEAIAQQRRPLGCGLDGLEALKIVNALYQANETGQTVKVSATVL